MRTGLFLVFILPIVIAAQAYQGYTLFGPNNGKNTYLVNMQNQVVKTWTHTKNGGYSYYLLPDGSLMRTANSTSSSLNGGGATGVVQKCAWDGTLTWEYTYATSSYRSHHDIEPMPNGNVLIVAWETKTAAQATAVGSNRGTAFWPDHIIEVQPTGSTGGNIVWEWHAYDHMIQDYDAGKLNYGVVSEHPELLDINMGGTAPSGDWMHINGISYNPDLDQIAISSHTLNEVYVIDHSTTSAQAATHTGGRYGKGGDILYRWGNSANYKISGTRVFDVVHCAAWVTSGLPGAGHLMAYNNRQSSTTSVIVELTLPADTPGVYKRTAGAAYGPASPSWSYTASGFYSNHLGGIQRLPNGNTLVSESTVGYLFEVDQTGNTVWSYNRGGEIVRVLRYPPEYSGLSMLTATEKGVTPAAFTLEQNYPNPFNPSTAISFTVNQSGPVSLTVFNSLGEQIAELYNTYTEAGTTKTVDFSGAALHSGVYFYRLKCGTSVATKQMLLLK